MARMDTIDRLVCDDVVCDHGGHQGCRPPIGVSPREVEAMERTARSIGIGSDAWWRETVERMRRHGGEDDCAEDCQTHRTCREDA